MLSEDEKLVKLEKAVQKDTSMQIDEIIQEAETSKNDMLDKANDLSLYDAYDIIKDEIKKISGKYIRLVSQAELDSKKQVLLYREKLAEQIIDNVKQALEQFTKTEDYKSYISKMLKNEADSEQKVIVYICERDRQLVEEIIKTNSYDFDLAVRNCIKIGGVCICYEGKNVLKDMTIDTALSDEKDRFINSNCFKIC